MRIETGSGANGYRGADVLLRAGPGSTRGYDAAPTRQQKGLVDHVLEKSRKQKSATHNNVHVSRFGNSDV